MISSTSAYQEAIVADTRRIYLKVIVDISDPDLVFGAITYSGIASDVCVPGQVEDKIFQLVPFGTLETDRWILDGTMQIFPDSPSQLREQAGFIGDVLSEEDGTYETPVWVEIQFENVSILQACSVYFPTAEYDGVPDTFKVEIFQGGTAYYTKTFTNNTESTFHLDGFTVMNPDAIRVTVSKWSRSDRRLRVVEIVPGVYEDWTGDMIASFSVKHQGDVSCMTLPYGTCSIKMDNLSRRFEPRSKDGIFQSIEERQNIDVQMGVRLEDGTDEYKRLGRFFQYSGGWKTGDNGITMQWSLVDIVGLLQSREFIPPSSLPTTLSGWVSALVAQLGENFEDMYSVDPNYSNILAGVNSPDDVLGMKCGDILRYVCMATGTWPRADAETGKLAVEPLWNQGNKITLDNLQSYPTIKANEDVAALIFKLNDGNDTQYIVSGNSTASSETKSIQNPFIKTEEQALTAAKMILATYGGNRIETTGRGDMTSEIGDVDTVWLDESSATTARRIQQTFALNDGVLKDCQSILLQADGAFLFENMEILTESGQWTAPAQAGTTLRVILVGGGNGGNTGADGTWDAPGENGEDGVGALIWAGTIQINPQQTFEVTIGQGGGIGQDGTATVFGQYSSANGQRYSPSYTDVASGNAYGRTGVQSPAPNTGDGGKGGEGGIKGNRHEESFTFPGGGGTRWVIDNYPGEGQPGKPGASGCVVIYWDKGE